MTGEPRRRRRHHPPVPQVEPPRPRPSAAAATTMAATTEPATTDSAAVGVLDRPARPPSAISGQLAQRAGPVNISDQPSSTTSPPIVAPETGRRRARRPGPPEPEAGPRVGAEAGAETAAEPELAPPVLLTVGTRAWAPLDPVWLAADSIDLDPPTGSPPKPDAEAIRQSAERAYATLAAEVRNRMTAFVGRANATAGEIARAYEQNAGAVIAGHDQAQSGIDRAADQSAAEIELAEAQVHDELAATTRATRSGIEAAGRRAYALIDASDRAAGPQLAAVVAGLVSGHVAAYDGSIKQVRDAADAATVALRAWPARRGAEALPVQPLDAAKEEERRQRIPVWVRRETARISEQLSRPDGPIATWTTARDRTRHSLECSFRASLEADRRGVNVAGRRSIAGVLRASRQTLTEQSAAVAQTLHEVSTGAVRQLRGQTAALKTRLNAQTASTLAGLRQEAGSAIRGLQTSARGVTSAFARPVTSFGQQLQRARGNDAALRSTMDNTPQTVRRGADQSATAQDAQLDGTLNRLRTSLGERAAGQADQQRELSAMAEAGRLAQVEAAQQSLDGARTGFATAVEELPGSITQAADGWARSLRTRMAQSIASKRLEAAAQLTSLLTGQPVPVPRGREAAARAARPDAGATTPEPAPGCASETAPAPRPTVFGPPAAPIGLSAETERAVAAMNRVAAPGTYFATQLNQVGAQVLANLETRASNVAKAFTGGFLRSVDEEGVIAALRGLSALKGRALNEVVYPANFAGSRLDTQLGQYLDNDFHRTAGTHSDDYRIAINYLRGNTREAARLELLDSVGLVNDQEARIEATLRALSPEDLRAVGADPELHDKVRGALDGVDQDVYDALTSTTQETDDTLRYARADAHRVREKGDEALREQNYDAVHTAVETYTAAPGEGDWRSTQEVSGEQRRAAVATALGQIVRANGFTAAPGDRSAPQLSDTELGVAYLSREVPVLVDHGDGMRVEMRAATGANRDLTAALLRHGADSYQARGSRVGVEMQRAGGAKTININRALHDERFAPAREDADPAATARARSEARDDRARLLLVAAQYAGSTDQPAGAPDPALLARTGVDEHDAVTDAARQRVIARLDQRYGDDTLGRDAVRGLLTDERPTAQTASLVMRHAMYSHSGTDEELLIQFTERRTRAENVAMAAQFKIDTGDDLQAELGTNSHGGWFTELSGDDRLRMERALRGTPMNEREELENAAFALHQQRREAGVGAGLADGDLADQMMSATEQRLQQLAGGPIDFNAHGELITAMRNFDAQGRYVGTALDHDEFVATTTVAQTVADSFAANLDSYADILTTGIAVIGAIAAAAITVATGGAAAPLIAAALVTGLASMAANRLIKGGRYGWEQAGIDLGMTVVQAITAGVGAQLGKAAQLASGAAKVGAETSRTLIAFSRLFTGNPVVDQIVIGIVSGSIGGLGGAAFDEKTWEHGGDPLTALFGGLLKGGLAGGATAAVAQSVEALGRNAGAITRRANEIAQKGGLLRGAVGAAGRGVGRVGAGLNTGMTASTGGGLVASTRAVAARSLTRGVIGGLGGVAGRGAELAYDAATGKFKGDAGEVWSELGVAGARSAFQGLGEGAAEARAQRYHDVHHPETVHATVGPSPAHEELMRAQLTRHLPPELHAQFADTPIRVVPEAEYAARTQSRSGPVVTLIENGRPVVLLREGTPVTRLADEGPHLAQLHDPRTRTQALRLDESTLARWDQLGLDVQLDLYRTKIGLEIDAHQRVHASLEAERAALPDSRTTAASRARIESELARNTLTLGNLRARAEEVSAIGPDRRAAIVGGQENRPQWLEQPARLFSKDADRPLFGPTVDEQQERIDRRERGNTFNNEMAERFAREGERAQHEVRLQPGEGGKGQPRADTVVAGRVIAEHKYSQLAEIGVDASIDRINELADLYHPGARIAAVPSTAALRAEGGDLLRGQQFLVLPEQHAPIPRAVLEHAERVGVLIRDADGRVYDLAHPDGDDGVRRASTRDPDEHGDAMRSELLRHVPPAQHELFADVPIVILPVRDYHEQTGSERGPVVTMIIGEHPVVVIREGTPIRRLADEGPHLQQWHEEPTRALVLRHDEAVLRQWPHLDLDTQVALYRNKLALEIDAHQRIVTALESAAPQTGREQLRALAELDRAHETLRNLRARQQEVAAMSPGQLAAIRAGGDRPQWLDQPARLFSKNAPPPVDRTTLATDAAEVRSRLAARAAAAKQQGATRHAARTLALAAEIKLLEARLTGLPKGPGGEVGEARRRAITELQNERFRLRLHSATEPATDHESTRAVARLDESEQALRVASMAAEQARSALVLAQGSLTAATQLAALGPDPTAAQWLSTATREHARASRTAMLASVVEQAAVVEHVSVVRRSNEVFELRTRIAAHGAELDALLLSSKAAGRTMLSGEEVTRRNTLTWALQSDTRALALAVEGLNESLKAYFESLTPGKRGRTPAMRNAAELDPLLRPRNGLPIDVTTGLPSTEPWSADHIVARGQLARHPRVARLTRSQQLVLAFLPENFFPMPVSLNSSKLDRTMSEWIEARPLGRMIQPKVAEALLAAEARAWEAIEAKIAHFEQLNEALELAGRR